jgi:hypothetical protein
VGLGKNRGKIWSENREKSKANFGKKFAKNFAQIFGAIFVQCA